MVVKITEIADAQIRKAAELADNQGKMKNGILDAEELVVFKTEASKLGCNMDTVEIISKQVAPETKTDNANNNLGPVDIKNKIVYIDIEISALEKTLFKLKEEQKQQQAINDEIDNEKEKAMREAYSKKNKAVLAGLATAFVGFIGLARGNKIGTRLGSVGFLAGLVMTAYSDAKYHIIKNTVYFGGNPGSYKEIIEQKEKELEECKAKKAELESQI